MSDTSSTLSENIQQNKNNVTSVHKKSVNYTTDYHPNILQNEMKLKNPEHPVVQEFSRTTSVAPVKSERKSSHYDDQSSESSRRSNSSRSSTRSKDSLSEYTYDKPKEYLPKESKLPVIIEEPKKEEEEDNYNSLNPEQQRIKKMDMLRKLGELTQYGVKLSQNYNMQSDYFIMKQEYELHTNIRAKQNSVNWMSSLMMNCIYGLEIMNDKYNPFDLKLAGWSQQINADANSYYEVFGEIYEKYNKPGKNMSPELKLMLMVSGSALKFHLNKTLLSDEIGKKYIEQHNVAPSQHIIDQMAIAKMQEEQARNAELLRKKTEEEHMLATKQVQDIQYLQQQQMIYEQQQRARQAELDHFEQIKNFMETRPKSSKPPENYSRHSESSNDDIADRLGAIQNRINSRRNSHHTENNSATSDDTSKKSKNSRGSRKSKYQKFKSDAIKLDI